MVFDAFKAINPRVKEAMDQAVKAYIDRCVKKNVHIGEFVTFITPAINQVKIEKLCVLGPAVHHPYSFAKLSISN